MDSKPKADKDGFIIGHSLLSVATWKLPDGQILLGLEVAQNEQELRAMKGQTIQLFLKPIQAMDLARVLTDVGELKA